MRNTKGGNTDIRCYIVRLDSTIFLKLGESNFLLYATRFSILRSLVKRLGMGLPNNLPPEMGSLGHNGFGNPFFGAQWVHFVNFSVLYGATICDTCK